MVAGATQSIQQSLRDFAEKALPACDVVEHGQAIQPCCEALKAVLADNLQGKSFLTLGIRDACHWVTSPLLQARDRSSRESAKIKERLASPEFQRCATSHRASSADKDTAKAKERLMVALSKIDKAMTLASDCSVQPLGKWTNTLREITSDFELTDFEKSQTSTTLKFSMNAGHLAKISRRIDHEIRSQLNSDLKSLQDAVRKAHRKIFREYGVPESEQLALNLPKLSERDFWKSVENLITVGKEAQIEFQRRGVFDILTAGRQKVFMVIMFLSLMGRMGLPNLFASTSSKTAFGIFLASVMISSMVSSILIWRREKAEQGEKELKKIRESLLQDAMRIIDQIEKAKMATCREYLKDVLSCFETTIKTWSEDSANRSKAKQEEAQEANDNHRKALDSRMKALIEVERTLSKTLESISTIDKAEVVRQQKIAESAAISQESSISRASDIPIASLKLEPTTEVGPSSEAIPEASNPNQATARPETRPMRVSSLAERRQQRLAESTN